MTTKETVLCHGVFDIIHAGHLAYFKAAKAFGKRLVVSITTDQYVNKGPGRPYFTTTQRAEMLKAMAIIDEVVISDSPTAINVIEQLKPDWYVKGPDYKDLSKDVTGEIYNEKAAVEKHGGQLVFTDEPTQSSGTIINKFFADWSEEQKACIEKIRAAGGIDAITHAVEEIAKLKVLIVGEPILDIYRFVSPEGISSKSPSISARFNYEETYHGGSIAIRNHLESFAQSASLQAWDNLPAKKVRYISGNQRIFEVTDIQDQYWNNTDPTFFIDKVLEVANKSDVVLLADFGHGMFEGPVLKAMDNIHAFTGLNVQTNSSNFGFNVYTKHNRFDYLCIDTREARLAMHDRWQPSLDLAEMTSKTISPRLLSMTLGPNGACMIDGWGEHFCAPAFADNIVDATGAGDAYFAITTCLLKAGCKREMIPFIGNVFAGLKTKIIGNKLSVSKAALLKACAGILK